MLVPLDQLSDLGTVICTLITLQNMCYLYTHVRLGHVIVGAGILVPDLVYLGTIGSNDETNVQTGWM